MTTAILRKALDHFADLLRRHVLVGVESAVLDIDFGRQVLEQAHRHCTALLDLLDQVDAAETIQLDDGTHGPVDLG